MEKKKNIPKPLVPLLSIAATAGSIYGIFSKAAGFLDLLLSEGTDAFGTFIRPAILGLLALILSFSYITSTGKKKGQTAEDGSSSGSAAVAADRVLRTLVKFCICIVILGIIYAGVSAYLSYKEYTQRPTVNVYDYIDIAPAIEGYEGQATFDESRVENNLPYDLREIYSETNTKNYDHNEDYTEGQEAWGDFCNNLHFTYTGGTENLTNDDEIVLTIDYQGKDLSRIKAKTRLRIEGVGEPKHYKVGDLADLPHLFENAAQAKEEKSDVIADVESYLTNYVQSQHNDASDITCASFLCKPKYSEDSAPDALVVVARYLLEFGGEQQASYVYCYLYPFDSRASSDMITQLSPDYTFANGPFPYYDVNEIEQVITRGDPFYNASEYTMEAID